MSEAGRFWIGLAIWSFKDWVGGFYPQGSQPGDFLTLYGQRVTAVEGNTTFYAVPGADVVRKWAEQVPEGFRFCPKVHRDVTHGGPLVPQLGAARDFVDRMLLLGERLGPIFAQLPPTYGPENLKDLANFLGRWPRDEAPLMLEVRHPAWFVEPHAGDLRKLLTNLDVGRVILDTRPIYEADPSNPVDQPMKKPHLPVAAEVVGGKALVRLISHPRRELNEPYLKEWAWRVDRWLDQGTDVYFFVHCPDDTFSPDTLRWFHDMLVARGAAVPPLPWAALPPAPSQLKLF